LQLTNILVFNTFWLLTALLAEMRGNLCNIPQDTRMPKNFVKTD